MRSVPGVADLSLHVLHMLCTHNWCQLTQTPGRAALTVTQAPERLSPWLAVALCLCAGDTGTGPRAEA